MCVGQRVNGHGNLLVVAEELLPNVKLWLRRLHAHKLHKGGKALVQPQQIPPLHGHEVAKPLRMQARAKVSECQGRANGGWRSKRTW